MPAYSFKKTVKFYIVYSGLRYRVDVYPDLSFSQTFDEKQINVKTLHAQGDMFDEAVINKANPANFSFTTPLRSDMTQRIALDLLLDYDSTSTEKVLKTADIYVDNDVEIYKLEKCVFESGSLQLVRDRIVLLSINGTARKLSRAGASGVFTIPGTPQTYIDSEPYMMPLAHSIE